MRKGQPKLLDLLVDSPWWISVLLAVVAYVVFSYIFPLVDTGNPYLNMLKNAFTLMATYFSLLLLLPAPFAYFNARRKRQLLNKQRDIDSIKSLGWKAFEELVAEAFRRQGYKVRENGFGPDGGIDIRLIKDNQLTLVQCKQWRSRQVGVSVVREMYGLLNAEQAHRVMVICSGSFTRDACEFAHNKPIELMAGEQLLALIKDVQANQNSPTEQPAVVDELSHTTNCCPNCGSQLVIRQAKRGPNAGQAFLGCTSFPKCRFTRTNISSLAQEGQI